MSSKEYNPDYLLIPGILVRDKEITPLQEKVYGVIYWYAKMKCEKCIAGNKTIGKVVGSSGATIANALTKLEERGYIKRIFSDEAKKNREEIIPLVSFSGERIPLVDDTGITEKLKEVSLEDEQISNNTISNIYKYSLPEPMGKNYQKRIFYFYSLVWNKMYGTYPTADYARLGKTLKSLHDNFSEYQVAMLILKHFDWYGASGDDSYANQRLSSACFPISWIPASADAYKAVIINSDGIQFDSEEACKEVIDKYLKIK